MSVNRAAAQAALVLLLFVSVSAQITDGGSPLSISDAREGLGFEDSGKARTLEETDRLLEQHFKLVDTNGDGFIDYNEMDRRFHQHMSTRYKEQHARDEKFTKIKFDETDIDHSGHVSKNEYIHSLQKEDGEEIDDSEKDEFQFFDLDNDLQLSYSEYKDLNDPWQSSRRTEFVEHEAAREMDIITEGAPGKITWEQVYYIWH
jgi:Ca2+-binding EF-hand superfamily protein